MAESLLVSLRQLVTISTRLGRDFHLFLAAEVKSKARDDIEILAREVSALSRVLRQAATKLDDEGDSLSHAAIRVLKDVFEQFHMGFKETEVLLQHVYKPESTNSSSRQVSALSWHRQTVLADRLQYLPNHLGSLRLTLEVVLQALYTAKMIAWADHVCSPAASAAAKEETLQLTNLVAEQQSILFHLNPGPREKQNTVQQYRRTLSPVDLDLHKHPNAVSLPRDRAQSSRLAIDGADGYSETLLSTWFRAEMIQHGLRSRLASVQDRTPAGRSNWQPPTAVSEDENDNAETASQHEFENLIPVQAHQRSDAGRPANCPDQHELRHVQTSSGLSSSKILEVATEQAQSSSRTSASLCRGTESMPMAMPIPWRVRVNQRYWDYKDARLVYSNTRMSIQEARKAATSDTPVVTEVCSAHVTSDALREAKYDYIKIPDTKMTGCPPNTRCHQYSIQKHLIYEDVARLARRRSDRRPYSNASGSLQKTSSCTDRQNRFLRPIVQRRSRNDRLIVGSAQRQQQANNEPGYSRAESRRRSRSRDQGCRDGDGGNSDTRTTRRREVDRVAKILRYL